MIKKITSKKIPINEYENEIRYFAESDDGFDGNAQGYGYKSVEKLKKAYWWYKEGDNWKKKVQNRRIDILTYFRINKNSNELYGKLLDFFHPDNAIYLMKERETYDRNSFLDYYNNMEKPLDEILQNLHIDFSSLADFFTSLYEEEEKLKQRYANQLREKRRRNKINERKQKQLKKYGNDFFVLRKKIKIYCETNSIPCPKTNSKKNNWFKHLSTEKQEIIRNIVIK